MEFTEAVKAYLEIGSLGIFTVIGAVLLITLVKSLIDRFNKKDDSTESKFNAMIELLQQQNKEYQEQQIKSNEMLIQNIIHGITSHVPSPEENEKLTTIQGKINEALQEILITTNASRVNLVQYHNGGKGINKQSFLKMSITNEQVQLGVKPLMSEFKDQFRSVLSYFVHEIHDNGHCYIEDYEKLQDVDSSMYEFLRDRGVQAKFGIALHDKNGMIIGFVCAEFLDKANADIRTIDKSLTSKQQVFETLLNL